MADRPAGPAVSGLPLPRADFGSARGVDDRRWPRPNLHSAHPRRATPAGGAGNVLPDCRPGTGPGTARAHDRFRGPRDRQSLQPGPGEHPAEPQRVRGRSSAGTPGPCPIRRRHVGPAGFGVVLAGHDRRHEAARVPLRAGIGIPVRRGHPFGRLCGPPHHVACPTRGSAGPSRRRQPGTADSQSAARGVAGVAAARLPGSVTE